MRSDNRPPGALRPVSFERGFTKHAPGSVLVSFGDTKVICTATFEERPPAWLRDSGKGWVTAEYAMLPGATHTRNRRDSARKGRALEISRLIGRSLRAAVDLEAVGPCQIIVDCDVIQADGGTRTAAITGAYVALYDALRSSVEKGRLDAVPMRGGCAAVSVGVVDGAPLLDLCYEEDVRAEVDMNVVMNEAGEFIEIQGCAEGKPFSQERMTAMLELSSKGIQELIALQREALGLG